jgi:phosphate transport system substrate-binding protein
MRFASFIVSLLTLSAVVAGEAGETKVLASTSCQLLLERVVPAFAASPDGSPLEVNFVSSTVLVSKVVAGEAAIGINSRNLKAKEKEASPVVVATPIGFGALVVTMPAANPITNLSSDQVCGIWTGAITNWQELGGPDLAIVAVGRTKAYDPIRLFGDFMKLETKEVEGGLTYRQQGTEAWSTISAEAAATDEQALATLAAQRGAISYFPLGRLLAYKIKGLAVKGLTMNAIAATPETIAGNTYAISRTLNAITPSAPTGSSKALIDFLLSASGQKLVAEAGFVPLGQSQAARQEILLH